MDFTNASTAELLNALPPAEDDRWEWKGADLLGPKRGELRTYLGKQVSAFANSGGGFLVLGLNDKTKQIEPCEQQVGRQPMKDYLATIVEQSVEPPIQRFTVHRIPMTANPSESVFVVAIQNSPAAPHQSKDARVYFHRIDGQSKPAPHFYLELLRNQLTRPDLAITDVDYGFEELAGNPPNLMKLAVRMIVTVENRSLIMANAWGIHLRDPRENCCWRLRAGSGDNLCDGCCFQSQQNLFLPSQRNRLLIPILGSVDMSGLSIEGAIERTWRNLLVVMKPISDCSVGEERVFSLQDPLVWSKQHERRFEDWIAQCQRQGMLNAWRR